MPDANRADLNLLRALAVLIEEGNVTRAAARLGVSQPAMSAQLARLRDLFDDPLMVPSDTGRGMVPTPRAVALREPLDAVFAQVNTVLEAPEAFDPMRARRAFTIAASDNGTVVLGMALFAELAQMGATGIHLAFVPLDRTRLRGQFEAGEVDMMIALLDVVPQGLKTRVLTGDRQVIVQRKGHPRGTGPFDLAQYCRWPHVIIATDGAWRTVVDDELDAANAKREVALTVPQFMLALNAVSESDLFALIPARLAKRFSDRVDMFDLPFPSKPFSLQAAWHPRSHTDPGHRWLRETLGRVAGRT